MSRQQKSDPPVPLLPEEGWPKAGVEGAAGGQYCRSPHDSKGVTFNADSRRIATAFMPWNRNPKTDLGGGSAADNGRLLSKPRRSWDNSGKALGTNK